MEEMKKMKKMIHKIDKIQKKKMHNYLLRQLTEAVAQNNFAKVEELLKHGATINGKDTFNTSPLEYAVRSANVEMIQYLIQAGADIDITDDENYTCLMRAIQIFLNKGAFYGIPIQIGDNVCIFKKLKIAPLRCYPSPPVIQKLVTAPRLSRHSTGKISTAVSVIAKFT